MQQWIMLIESIFTFLFEDNLGGRAAKPVFVLKLCFFPDNWLELRIYWDASEKSSMQ